MYWEATRLTHRDYQSFAAFHKESLNSAPAETFAVCSYVIAEITNVLMPINWVLLALNGKDQWRRTILEECCLQNLVPDHFSMQGFHVGVPDQSAGARWIWSSSQTDAHSVEPTRETFRPAVPSRVPGASNNPNLGKHVHVYIVKSPLFI